MKKILLWAMFLNFFAINLWSNIYIFKDDTSGTTWGNSYQGTNLNGGSFVHPSGNIPNDTTYNYNANGINSLLINWGYNGSDYWYSYFRGDGTGDDAESANNILNDCSLPDLYLILWIRATNTSIYPIIKIITNSGGYPTPGNSLSLSSYGVFQVNQWKRFVIPIADFGLTATAKSNVYGVKFANGDTGTNKMWVDYVYFTVSTNDYTPPVITSINFSNNQKLSVYSNLQIKVEDTNTIVNLSSITMILIQNNENNGTVSTQILLTNSSYISYDTNTKILKYNGSIISNGTISIHISARDCVENYTNNSFTITVQRKFTIYDEYNEVPEDGFEYTLIGDNTFTFYGSISGRELYANGSKVTPDSAGNYKINLTLSEGDNSILFAKVINNQTNYITGVIKYYRTFENNNVSYIGHKNGTSLSLLYGVINNGSLISINTQENIFSMNDANIQLTSKIINIISETTTFNSYASINIKVSQTFLNTYEKEKLSIFYYNNVEWIKLATTYNKDNMVFSSKILHSGIYALCVDNRTETKVTKIKSVPQVFSPNNDGTNDEVNIYFNVSADASVKLKIFNLNGDLVYETSKLSFNAGINLFRWDGKNFNNKVVSDGVYIYYIEITGENNSYNIYKGTVTVVTP